MILVVNAGSSSIKGAVFDAGLVRLLRVSVTGIGGQGRIRIDAEPAPCDAPDHAAALALLLDALASRGIEVNNLSAAAHRVVHGGPSLVAPCRITPEVAGRIEAAIPLAPLHNPHNLGAIRALAGLVPKVAQYASFDTAFHATNPEVARRYAIPAEDAAAGIRRYGFHGISYAGLVHTLPELSGAPLPRRLLALHLGNGASLCAILAGRSVATTMGYSPLDGLTMGTRSGEIDGNAVLRLAQIHGIAEAGRRLNHDSGLKALGGLSDMRALHAAGTPEARFAIDHFCYWAGRHAGAMIAAMGGLDAVVFTGGIGENDAVVRAAIAGQLEWLGLRLDPAANAINAARLSAQKVGAWILPADEERSIARDAASLIAGVEN